jgi:Aspartyl protease
MIKFIITIAIFLFSIMDINAQITEIPFELLDNKSVFIKLPINDSKESLKFYFDTGATNVLIDSTVAKKMNLISDYQQDVGGAGGSKKYQLVLNQKINITNIKSIDSIHFILDDLTRIKKSINKNFDGIVGYSILKDYKTKIDFDKKIMQLYNFNEDIDLKGYKAIAFTFDNNITIPQFPITIKLKNGKNFFGKILFDSGAGLTLLINTPFKNENNLIKNIGKTSKTTSDNLSKTSVLENAVIESIQIGDFKFDDCPIKLSSDTDGVSSYKNYLGILGNEFINRFNLVLDYSKQKMYLKPNSLFKNKFEFPVSGIKLKSENKEIIVSDVDAESEAFRLGLRVNFKIVSINNLENKDLKFYNELLKNENKIVKITFLNDNSELKTIKLKLRRII